ncbi:hypothetical protein O181_024847 [Austropuccinia psidii MF-1]|uniref:EF-hand domain-containing protein n=1 Tax=Austropuccinia psidii MF-1 TaxID=1389203 RepID=A0A9Q3CMB2_9BASI|nr:hypothetical protein [Austropuccinia psidii MF-1]
MLASTWLYFDPRILTGSLPTTPSTLINNFIPVQKPAPAGWIFLDRKLQKPSLETSSLLKPTSPQRMISMHCTETWISTGNWCENVKLEPAPIDLLWTWVNESLITNMTTSNSFHTATTVVPIKSSAPQNLNLSQRNPGPNYLYREHDELRFSLRSTVASLPSRFIRSFQLITADRPGENLANWPLWLLRNHSSFLYNKKYSKSRLLLRHHSEIFQFKNDRDISHAEAWRQHILPSHNSLAIESQLAHHAEIEDNVLYLNDDCFFFNKFSEGDFATELYGPVFRLQFDLKVKDDVGNYSGTQEALGEWPSLGYSNWLLSKRFGQRERRYLLHLPKVLSVQIMKEVSLVWKDEIFTTASSRFRGNLREINMMFLTTWYHIEKHREALLHSFLMLKSDSDQDGVISGKEWETMMSELKASSNEENPGSQADHEEIKVLKPFRPRGDSIEDILGEFRPRQTDYRWLSSDGYPLLGPNLLNVLDYDEQDQEASPVICELNLTVCFPNESSPLWEGVLKRVAFEEPQCGDCLIALLVGKQKKGMASFLPPFSSRARWLRLRSSKNAHLSAFASVGNDWKKTRFYSNQTAHARRFLGSSQLLADPRMWALRNIQRYQYVLGDTWSEFHTMTSPISTKGVLERLYREYVHSQGRKLNRKGLMLTMNDRILEPYAMRIELMFKSWPEAGASPKKAGDCCLGSESKGQGFCWEVDGRPLVPDLGSSEPSGVVLLHEQAALHMA